MPSKAFAEVDVIKMAKPRFAASILAEVNVVSSFRGQSARIARKLNVSCKEVPLSVKNKELNVSERLCDPSHS